MSAASVHILGGSARSVRFMIAAVLALILAVTAGIVFGSAPARAAETDDAVVVRVIDGDTVVMKVNGRNARVRLLNVDTPETKDPNAPVQCLGPEAAAFLTTLLPVGEKVTLKYDEERRDRYGRTLAAVFTQDDKFVSAEIAKRGLGMAVEFGGNDAYLAPVQAAQQAARSSRAGFYSADMECTVPAQVKALQREMTDVAGADSTTAASGDVTALVTRSAAVMAGLDALRSMADHDHVDISMGILLTTPKLSYAAGLRKMSAKSVSLNKKLVVRESTAVAREAAAVLAAAEEAAAIAEAEAEEAAAADAQKAADAQRAADAQATADRAAAQARADAAARAARAAPAPYVAPEVAPPSSGGVDTYTGCRAYGNAGTSVDNKGRRYTKIPC